VVYRNDNIFQHPAKSDLRVIEKCLDYYEANRLVDNLTTGHPLKRPAGYQLMDEVSFKKCNKNKQLKFSLEGD
jgi:hypothetical protein